ncbi:MAG: hypothetical protein NC177_12395 [Ruminococcus flavefaciens]|nr:hypothetical protein [Ruminococcus flavefaciens]
MNELKRISIALLGGSTSGKTTFFSGIDCAFIRRFRMFKDKSFSFKLVSIKSGIVNNDDPNCEIQTVETAKFDTSAPAPAFTGAPQTPAFTGAPTATAFGGGGAPTATAFANAGTSKNARPKNNDKVNNISITEGNKSEQIRDAALLSAEMERAWNIRPEYGFNAGTATTKYVEATYRIELDGKPKCNLVITDYAGELIDNSAKVPEAMLTQLSNHIANSNAAIILANSRAMSNHIRDVITNDRCMFNETQTRQALSAQRLNDLMRNMTMENYCLLLAITQCDSPQVDKRMSQDNFARTALDLTNYIYQPTFVTARNNNWSRGIIPVSAIGTKEDGSPNVDEKNENFLPDADINQWNIDTALLFCIYNSVFAVQKQIEKELEEYKGFIINHDRRKRRDLLRQQNGDLGEIIATINSEKDIFNGIYQKTIPMEVHSDIQNVVMR